MPMILKFGLLMELVSSCIFSSQASLFIYSSRMDSSPLLFGTQCAPPFLQCVFIVLIAYYSVSLFSLGGGQSVQWAMLL
jgi:hypothetical protein